MDAPIRILSTKTLAPSQKERILAAGFSLVESAFVTTRPLEFEAPDYIDKAIITSSNAVQPIKDGRLKIGHCYCVGEKTRAVLTAAGYTPEICETSAAKLGEVLMEKYQGEAFYFLGTRARRDELPEILKANGSTLSEIPVYETILNSKAVGEGYDGILFFSPSAVTAYLQKNSLDKQVCFCIGPTTANALKDQSVKVVTAKAPTAEHLILETIKHFKPKKTTI